jgi:hypothetical protein
MTDREASQAGRADTVRRFELFLDREVRRSSPVYAALTDQVAQELAAGGPIRRVVEAAPERQRIPNLLFAAVHRVLFDHPDAQLAEYYPSVGGARLPDLQLAAAFDAFVEAHRERIESLLATGETQTNEVLRSAQIFPALGWAQACTRRSLGLIEVGTSAGLLLHADRYGYVYEFEDGATLEAGGNTADGVPLLHSPVSGAATPKTLAPFVTRELRVTSRVGLDLNPLDPADPEARAWLRALVWPEHAERRARLDAALDHAARRPVRLRRGDALRILPDAVDSVAAPAIPCVFVSNSLPHWSAEGRAAFAELIRDLGARRDLVCIVKESHRVGLGLFTGQPDPDAVADPAMALGHEVIAAVVLLGGREQIFRLGTAGMHGVGLDWDPQPVL